MKEGATTIRQQYLRIKKKYPQAIVLFRLGDFYETFDEDARIASRELELGLTRAGVEPGLLDSTPNNRPPAVVPGEGEVGLAYVDITTSEFYTTQLPRARAI